MELDKDRMENYLYQIATEAADLEKVLEASDREILSDRVVVKSLKYSVIVIAEAMAGTMQHILAKKHNISIDGYSDAFSKSSRYGVVSEALMGRLRPFLVFRNMLVHQYRRIKDEVFLENLRAGLGDFREFVAEIQRSTYPG